VILDQDDRNVGLEPIVEDNVLVPEPTNRTLSSKKIVVEEFKVRIDQNDGNQNKYESKK
jgi:hypothetical protein